MGGSGESEEQRAAIAGHVFSHPLRVRIFEVVNEVDMSPSQFLQSGAVPEDLSLPGVAYHFRALEKFGCLEIIREIPRRGVMEHVYRGCGALSFNDEEWAELSDAERQRISRMLIRGIVARADGAMIAGTFDARLDRHVTWMPIELDERGWKEMMLSLMAAFSKADAIRRRAAIRLAESGEEPIPATVGFLGFESPATPAPLTPRAAPVVQ